MFPGCKYDHSIEKTYLPSPLTANLPKDDDNCRETNLQVQSQVLCPSQTPVVFNNLIAALLLIIYFFCTIYSDSQKRV